MDVIYAALKEGFVKKEIYVVDCPTHIRFGDPMYFERFEGQKLERLVVDCKVPKNFRFFFFSNLKLFFFFLLRAVIFLFFR